MQPYPPDRFERLAKEFSEHADAIMQERRQGYSPDEDRLQNFHQIAAFRGKRPADVALDFMLKHVQRLEQAIASQRYDWYWQAPGGGEGLKQVLADIANYCILIAACIDEEVNGPCPGDHAPSAGPAS